MTVVILKSFSKVTLSIFVVSLSMVSSSSIAISISKVRIFIQKAAVILNGSVVISYTIVRFGSSTYSIVIFRIFFQDLVEVCLSLLISS